MMKYFRNKKFRGITLIEVLLGVFVFTTIVVATSAIFSSSFDVKKKTQNAQQKYSLVFGTLDEMGKFLSTSTLMTADSESSDASTLGTVAKLTAYSYSTNECVQFWFTNTTAGNEYRLQVRRRIVPDTRPYTDCSTSFLNESPAEPWHDAIDTYVSGRFTVRNVDTDSGEEHSGMILIFANIFAEHPSVPDLEDPPVTVQTVVSLRDYLPGT